MIRDTVIMLREQIRKDIAEAILKSTVYSLQSTDIEVTRTSEARFGDYTSNVALRISHLAGGKSLHLRGVVPENKQSALATARILADSLSTLPYVEKLEVAGPGFINFWIKPAIWQKEVEDVLGQEKLNLKQTSKKVIVEFTDPNPFKEFHIGHLYSNIVGEAISRLFEAIGARVKRANYQGDVGMHVAKALWGILRIKNYELRIKELEKESKAQRARFLGEAYALGAKAYEEDGQVKKEIDEVNKKIYEKDPAVFEVYEKGRQWSLDYFEEIYRRLGTKFDFYYFESVMGKVGADLVRENLKKVFIESEGAIIFPGEKYGLHNRVFINSAGLPTYEAKELGLAPRKYEDFPYDESIIVTGSEIVEYFKVLLAALAQIAPELAAKTRHIAHGMVRMPGGKISSRLGNVLLGESLLDEAVNQAKKEFDQVSDEVAEAVGVGAVKYALLKGNIGQDIKFSFEESITLSGNSGPYLQYTYARCRSVMAKVPPSPGLWRASPPSPLRLRSGLWRASKVLDFSDLASEEDLLLRSLGVFPDVAQEAAGRLAPNLIANYLYEIAQRFNAFYNGLPILKAGDAKRTRRLFLVQATADILKKGLYLLGISAPDKM